MEGSSRNLFQSTVSEFAWMYWEKSQKETQPEYSATRPEFELGTFRIEELLPVLSTGSLSLFYIRMAMFKNVDNFNFCFMMCYWKCRLQNASLCCQHMKVSQLFLRNTSSSSLCRRSVDSVCTWHRVAASCLLVHSRYDAGMYLLWWWVLWHVFFL